MKPRKLLETLVLFDYTQLEVLSLEELYALQEIVNTFLAVIELNAQAKEKKPNDR